MGKPPLKLPKIKVKSIVNRFYVTDGQDEFIILKSGRRKTPKPKPKNKVACACIFGVQVVIAEFKTAKQAEKIANYFNWILESSKDF